MALTEKEKVTRSRRRCEAFFVFCMVCLGLTMITFIYIATNSNAHMYRAWHWNDTVVILGYIALASVLGGMIAGLRTERLRKKEDAFVNYSEG